MGEPKNCCAVEFPCTSASLKSCKYSDPGDGTFFQCNWYDEGHCTNKAAQRDALTLEGFDIEERCHGNK